MMNKLFNYDERNDILSIHKGFSINERFKGNIDAGDIILDLSTKGRIRGLELMGASSLLKDLEINSLIDAHFNASIRSSSIMLDLFLKSKEKELPARIALPIKL